MRRLSPQPSLDSNGWILIENQITMTFHKHFLLGPATVTSIIIKPNPNPNRGKE